jgi:hypothetical protein
VARRVRCTEVCSLTLVHTHSLLDTLWRIRCASANARVFEVQVYGVEQQDSYIQSDGTNSSYVPTPAETLPNVALGRGNYSIADSVSSRREIVYPGTPPPPHTHTHTRTLAQELFALALARMLPHAPVRENIVHPGTPPPPHTHTHTHSVLLRWRLHVCTRSCAQECIRISILRSSSLE